ncbi:uncharacterized protein LOC105693006 [Athalia rosae]|uniref:uncharacterized protein LOC105693006 n=1 Tax=Athalia rosae TaxID=37344 RepID=UPI0020341837|nr:uncharacterized protein LOC105693006 [Athalia rosae]XP_012268051.2 uncharacterized protein LOC105693006 [Athalia rosae]
MELLVPTVSDIVFKYTWPIKRYMKVVGKKTSFDSSPFSININGIQSEWNLSIRFWKGPQGKKITNPVVLCLNMLNCSIAEIEQARVRFQFGIYNVDTIHWEFCHVNRTILALKTTGDIFSLGYRDLCIVDRHVNKSGDITVMVKIQIIQNEIERHNLSQDMAHTLRHPRAADARLSCGGMNNTEIPVQSGIIGARSSTLAAMIEPIRKVDNTDETCEFTDPLKINMEDKLDRVVEAYAIGETSQISNGQDELDRKYIPK